MNRVSESGAEAHALQTLARFGARSVQPREAPGVRRFIGAFGRVDIDSRRRPQIGSWSQCVLREKLRFP